MHQGVCGSNARCFNSVGSYYCQCRPGFTNVIGPYNFTAGKGKCQGEFVHCVCIARVVCSERLRVKGGICLSVCLLSICFDPSSLVILSDDDECSKDANICRNGKCSNLVGSYNCTCNDGFTHTGGDQKNCTGKSWGWVDAGWEPNSQPSCCKATMLNEHFLWIYIFFFKSKTSWNEKKSKIVVSC